MGPWMRTREEYPEELFSASVISALERAILMANREDGGAWQDFLIGIFCGRSCSQYAVEAAYRSDETTVESLMVLFNRLPEHAPHDIEFWVPGATKYIQKWLEF